MRKSELTGENGGKLSPVAPPKPNLCVSMRNGKTGFWGSYWPIICIEEANASKLWKIIY